ncbi:MAG TPA: disulfide bond formation protein B [Steroidobacteraceae bacterium]|nr:disulfide bond formation protein B [Steroidobacteraceae bacterium]
MTDVLARVDRRQGNLLGFAACAGLMAYALFCQYGLHLQPCPLCVLQRISVISGGLLFLAAAVHNPKNVGARVYGVLIGLALFAGMAVASRHIWIIAQPEGTVAECGASLDYMMDVLPWREVLGKVLKGSGECAKIDWHFLGLNMPTWVLISLVCVASWSAFVNWRAPRLKA